MLDGERALVEASTVEVAPARANEGSGSGGAEELVAPQLGELAIVSSGVHGACI